MHRYLTDTIERWVLAGHLDAGALHERVRNLALEEGLDDPVPCLSILEQKLHDKLAAQANWPQETDCDRLRHALQRLDAQGICSLHHAGYSRGEALGLAQEKLRATSVTRYHGYCFYHEQDVEHALQHQLLHLSFASCAGDLGHDAVIAQQILGVLRECGLHAEWEHSRDTRIVLPGFRWQWRSDAPAYTLPLSASTQRPLQVYYWFAASGRHVEPEQNCFMSPREIIEQLLPQLQRNGDYLGLFDHQGQALQLIREDDDDYLWVEIPDVARQGSHGCLTRISQLCALLEQLPERFTPAAFSHFSFRAWLAPEDYACAA